MQLRHLIIVLLTALVFAACSPTGSAVARFDNVVLTRMELDTRVARVQEALQAQQSQQPQGAPLPDTTEIEQQLVSLFIQQNLTLNLARQRGIAVSDAEVDEQITQFRTNFEQGGTTIDEVVKGQLGMPDSASPDFRQFVSSLVAQQKLADSLVTTDTVRAEITQQVESEASQEIEEANVSHILFTTQEDAQKGQERLNDGESFEDLAKELSTDTQSGPNGGELGWFERSRLPPEFADLEPGETTSEPVQTPSGFHIFRLNELRTGPAIPADQVQQAIDQRIQMTLQERRGQALQELIDTERQKAIDEGRLVEPTFPTPPAELPVDPGAPPVDPGAAPPDATVEPAAAPTATAAP